MLIHRPAHIGTVFVHVLDHSALAYFVGIVYRLASGYELAEVDSRRAADFLFSCMGEAAKESPVGDIHGDSFVEEIVIYYFSRNR